VSTEPTTDTETIDAADIDWQATAEELQAEVNRLRARPQPVGVRVGVHIGPPRLHIGADTWRALGTDPAEPTHLQILARRPKSASHVVAEYPAGTWLYVEEMVIGNG